MKFFVDDSVSNKKVFQTVLPKTKIDIDYINLGSSDSLLDQIFGPDPATPFAVEASPEGTDSAELGNDHETAHGDHRKIGAPFLETKLGRHKNRAEKGQTKQSQNLSNQVTMLRARLRYALEQLEHSRQTEASLRLSLAHARMGQPDCLLVHMP